MCLIAYIQNKNKFTKENFVQAFNNNPHGVGFVEVITLKVFKTLQLKEALQIYKTIQPPVAIHFRAASSGLINIDNCHPFPVLDGWLMHNGIISLMDTTDLSDTNLFCKFLNQNNFTGQQVFNLLKLFAKAYGKFLWVRPSSSVLFFGTFFEEGGNKFSNYSFRSTKWFTVNNKRGWDDWPYNYL